MSVGQTNLIRAAVKEATYKAWENKDQYSWWRGGYRWPFPSYAYFPSK